MQPFLSFLLMTSFIILSGSAAAQQQDNWRKYLEQLAEEEKSQTVIESMYEDLLLLENNPLNLNSVTREQLESLPMLSIEESDAICAFLEKNRPVYTVYELRNVPRLHFKTIEMILPFFFVGEMDQQESKLPISDIMKNGRHELQFRLDKTLTPRAGYKEYSDSILERYPNRKYSGEDYYNSLRYSLRYRNKMQIGFTAEKDAGEPFFKTNYRKGFDHYGAHLIVHYVGILKTLALGDYRVSFGQGLVLNNDFMVNKSWSTASTIRRTLTPKRHFSTAESGFFRGGAVVLSLGQFALTAIYSNKRIDANLSNSEHITSFKTDGLHRTPLEISKRRNIREEVIGSNINFRKHRFQMGISTLYYAYDKLYNPTLREYNRYYMRDSSNINASIDYSFQLPGLVIAGETAIAKNGAVATLNTLQYRHSTNLSFSISHRHYPISYNAMYGQAFAEGSNVQNEQGLYIATDYRPFANFAMTAYADFVKFPWLKYGIDSPSNALDFYFLGTYTLSPQSTLEARYKYKQKEKNMAWPDNKSRSVLPYDTQKLRIRYSRELPNGWNFRTTADIVQYREKHFPYEYGWMLSQGVSYRGKGTFSSDAYLAWFDADSYDSRLYSYERNLLNTFHMPSFYGRGCRAAASVKCSITDNISLSVKIGHTHYTNRETIGTGTEMIEGHSRTDLFTYLRWVF